MKQKSTCFISYSHNDIDRDTLAYFKRWLAELSGNRLKVLLDEDLNVGGNLNEFMYKLYEVDGIIIIMTPGYKQKVLNRSGGVYTEYKIIYDRYSELEDKKRLGEDLKIKNFVLIPILFSGTDDSSVLEQLGHIKYLNFINFRVNRNRDNELFITDHTKKEYELQISQIANEIITVSSLNSNFFKECYMDLFQKLFIELKAEWHEDIPKDLFVKIKAYYKVEHQVGCLLIGRKGSGKSTVTIFMAHQKEDSYKGVINVIVDKINMESLFSYTDIDRIQSDTKNVVSRQKTFQFIWELFFYLWCMEIVIGESKKGKLNSYQEKQMSAVETFISKIKQPIAMEDMDNHDLITEVFFNFSLDAVINFLDYCINEARPDITLFRADIISRFTLNQLLNKVFGKQVIEKFRNVIEICRRRILITLDGFDTAFDEFRKNSIRKYSNNTSLLEKRTLLEVDWLRALLKLVLTIKYDHKQSNKFYDLLDFCITIPKDRFVEILQTERDSYIYQKRYIELNWSGIELVILVRKRLEVLTDFKTDQFNDKTGIKLSAENRLSQLLENQFPNIPKNVAFNINDKYYYLPIFLYILRLSFWRPRDILIYFANILSIAKDMKNRRMELSSDAIRNTIKNATYRIINDEFINEFKSLLINIREVVDVFQESEQIIIYKQLEEKLSNVDFMFAFESNKVKNLVSKIKFLYEIGFLGFDINDEIKNRYGLRNKHAFYFNEGGIPLKIIGTSNFLNCNFIIHPIFYEYLHLNNKGTELILNLNWKYLHEIEALRQ